MKQVKKIAVVGGESTGKSTLCMQLAAHYNTIWIPEHAREYLEKLTSHYTENDVLTIAKNQYEIHFKEYPQANQYIFLDTDTLVTHVWHTYKYGNQATGVCSIQNNYVDAYILTYHDLPWSFDPLRESPSHDMRSFFTIWYKELILNTKKPFCIVKGLNEQRLQTAVAFIDNNLMS